MTVQSYQVLSEDLPPVTIGHVTCIEGSRITIDLDLSDDLNPPRVTVGSFVLVRAEIETLVAVVVKLSSELLSAARSGIRGRADLELVGQISRAIAVGKRFTRGIACHPTLGDSIELLPNNLLRQIYQTDAEDIINIGSLYHDPNTSAFVTMKDLLSKHFAILGATGVGKSSAVAVIIDGIVKSEKDVRVFVLDVHNEYANCFEHPANVIDPASLKLPFWLFSLEEFADVIYGGRSVVEEEIEILSELIPVAKNRYGQYKDSSERQISKKLGTKGSSFTVDTPVPFLLQDLISLIDERMGRLDNRASRMHYHRLITRVETIRNDPRYCFMFDNANVGGDVMGELLAHLFRLEPDGKLITVMQLAGLPAEVMDAVVCVLCRLAFEFGIWSDGAIPLLFLCEEAHRYASADRTVGFTPTRRALSRIAREGRKHGVHLGLVSQRPSELDPTILSQCSTVFAMRMTNDRDQAIMNAAISDSVNLPNFIPLLGMGEAIAFGEGVPLPVRVKFRELSSEALPRSNAVRWSGAGSEPQSNTALIGAAVERWRSSTMNKGPLAAEPGRVRSAQDEGSDSNGKAVSDQSDRRLIRRSQEPSEVSTSLPRFDVRAASGLWRTS